MNCGRAQVTFHSMLSLTSQAEPGQFHYFHSLSQRNNFQKPHQYLQSVDKKITCTKRVDLVSSHLSALLATTAAIRQSEPSYANGSRFISLLAVHCNSLLPEHAYGNLRLLMESGLDLMVCLSKTIPKDICQTKAGKMHIWFDVAMTLISDS